MHFSKYLGRKGLNTEGEIVLVNNKPTIQTITTKSKIIAYLNYPALTPRIELINGIAEMANASAMPYPNVEVCRKEYSPK